MDILHQIGLFLQTAIQTGTPILFAIVGGILCEKVGHMNLGVEGMMLMGASLGFTVACATGNPLLAMLAAGAAGAAGALIYLYNRHAQRKPGRYRSCADHIRHGAFPVL